MQIYNEYRPPPQRGRVILQIIARRFLRHCSRLSNRNRSVLISTIRQRAHTALTAFPKLRNPVHIDCPHVQQIITTTKEIIESIREGVRSEMETDLTNFLSLLSLLNAAKKSAFEISTNLPNADNGLTKKFTEFLSHLVGDVQANIARIDDACSELLDSISQGGHMLAMTYSTSRQYPAYNTRTKSRQAHSKDKISLPQTAANIFLKRI